MGPCFLIVDPVHAYARPLVEAATRLTGAAPLCVITGEAPADAPIDRPWFDGLERVAVPPTGLRRFASSLRARRPVLGVLPVSEAALRPSVELLLGLGSTWNPPGLLALLRDKYALKQHLRSVRPDLDVGKSRPVSEAKKRPAFITGPGRFVIKPNQGFGNRHVGYFSTDMPRAKVDAFIDHAGTGELVVEEYLQGREYFINSQVDHVGVAQSVAAFAYQRVWANGASVDWLTRKVHRRAPEFALLDAYAQKVVTALGLRRTPLHLEVKLDGGTPRLVELGARLVGNGNAVVCNRLHGTLDLFELAAAHYLQEGAPVRARLDWDRYDSRDLLYVHGVSLHRGVIHRLEGAERVERHPCFAGWVTRPAEGQRLKPTVDLFTAPYCFLLECSAGAVDLVEASAALREELQINRPGKPLQKLVVQVQDLLQRGRRRWQKVFPAGDGGGR